MVINKNMVGKILHYLVTSKSDNTSGLPEKIKGFASFMPGKDVAAEIKEYMLNGDLIDFDV